jgi:hypothetical protein
MKGGFAIGGVIGVLSVLAAPAQAATSRTEYVAQVDPICQVAYVAEKSAYKTFHRRNKRSEAQLKRGDLPAKAARKTLFHFYRRTAQATQSMLSSISPIPAAPGDEATIASWLAGRQQSVDKQRRAFRALAHGQAGRFFKLDLAAIFGEVNANHLVAGFGFAYCTKVSVIGPVG